jgi:hypothetical protein
VLDFFNHVCRAHGDKITHPNLDGQGVKEHAVSAAMLDESFGER